MTTPVPQPPPYPIVGNIRDLDPQNSIASLGKLSNQYGQSCLPDHKFGQSGLNIHINLPYPTTRPHLQVVIFWQDEILHQFSGAAERAL